MLLEEGLAEAQSVGDGRLQADVYKALAYVRERLGDPIGAVRAFEECKRYAERLQAVPLAMEATAGLARLALKANELGVTQSLAQTVWNYVGEHGMDSLPFEAHLACAEVFTALGDLSAARGAVEGGYRELIARSYKIKEPEWRRSFLENVPEHKRLLGLWQRLHSAQGDFTPPAG